MTEENIYRSVPEPWEDGPTPGESPDDSRGDRLMGKTQVISVRGKNIGELLRDQSFIYVGRRCAGWPSSIWGNPFKVKEYGNEALSLFERCLSAALGESPWPVAIHPPDALFRRMASRLGELKGRRLGCWCGSWEPGRPEILCHGVILAKQSERIGR